MSHEAKRSGVDGTSLRFVPYYERSDQEQDMKPVSEMTFEEAFAELEEVVRKLEAGGLTLEESLALYERGQSLAAYCNQQLDQAELKVSQLAPNGALLPFEPV